MGAIQLYLPGTLVKMDNNLARATILLDKNDPLANRIWASLIATIRTDDREFNDSYTVALKDIMPGSGGRAYKMAKRITDTLAKALMTIETGPDKGDPTYTAMPFFRRIYYKNGQVTAVFNDFLAPYLLQLKGFFTQYNLFEYLQLPSTYSQKLFQLLKSYESRGSVELQLDYLHTYLDAPASFKTHFGQFRIFVLGQAKKDIEKNTSLRFEFTAIKEGRAVKKVRFVFPGVAKAIATQEAKLTEDYNRKFAGACACRKAETCTKQFSRQAACRYCIRNKFREQVRERPIPKEAWPPFPSTPEKNT